MMYCSAQNTAITRLTDSEFKQLEEFTSMDSLHIVQITDSHEPGTQLIICGTIVKKRNGNPIPNLNIYLYHTDNTGEYQRQIEDDVTSARLNGTVMTNKEGRFTVKTILPGDYVTHPDTKHIHTIVTGAKTEDYEFYFEQFIIDYLRITIENKDQLYLIDLKKIDNGTLVGFITLEVKGL